MVGGGEGVEFDVVCLHCSLIVSRAIKTLIKLSQRFRPKLKNVCRLDTAHVVVMSITPKYVSGLFPEENEENNDNNIVNNNKKMFIGINSVLLLCEQNWMTMNDVIAIIGQSKGRLLYFIGVEHSVTQTGVSN